MKRIILTSVLALLAINLVLSQTSANPDTVCAGSTEEYKIESPNTTSTYTWGIYNSEGFIKTTNNSKITIQWNNTVGTDSLWVFETNKASCKGDTAKLTVVRIKAPTTQFNNQKLCYGNKLQIKFTGTPPFTLEYTFNTGDKQIIKNITDNPYTLSGESGKYVLLKVSSSKCSGTLVSGGITNASIAEPLKKLKIIRSN